MRHLHDGTSMARCQMQRIIDVPSRAVQVFFAFAEFTLNEVKGPAQTTPQHQYDRVLVLLWRADFSNGL